MFYLFRSDDTAAPDFFDVVRLKEAMGKALVLFFPLAGRLGVDDSGRVEIDCNGEGALFVVARSDIALDEIKAVKPSPELRRQLVPRVEPSSVVLAVKVCNLSSSYVNSHWYMMHVSVYGSLDPLLNYIAGYVLQMRRGGIRSALHHAAIDAMSAIHFIQTWSAFSRDGERAVLKPPCHDRTLLRARSPPSVHPDALSVFAPNLTFSDPSGPVASEAFAISKDQVASLKRLCGGASTFCAVSGLVWRCVCVARRLPPDSEARLTFLVNIRRRVNPPLPEHYFGNAVVRAVATAAVRDITSEALASVASRIGGAIDRVDDELVRSAIDYYEMAGMGSPSSEGTLPETVLSGISWLGMPLYDVDFGWGKPRVMCRAESNRGGFFYLMSNELQADGAGGVRVLMCMEDANMKELERLFYEALATC